MFKDAVPLLALLAPLLQLVRWHWRPAAFVAVQRSVAPGAAAPSRTSSRASPAAATSAEPFQVSASASCLALLAASWFQGRRPRNARSWRLVLADGQGSRVSEKYRMPSSGIAELPQLLKVPAQVTQVIQSFASKFRDSPKVTWITGKRVQVYMLGEKSEPFLRYVRKHEHGDIVLGFLAELKQTLTDIAGTNGGEPSENIATLVGAEEMQVPHTDLLPGQVQVILALTPTRPTLVYDPSAEKPSEKEIASYLGVKAKDLQDEGGSFALLHKGYPLALPVSHVYDHMVHSYSGEFKVGDAVQIADGIVHAGPHCEDSPEAPRMVVFMTYKTEREEHYDFTFQVKLWDWASHPSIPPMVAYRRLFEVYQYGVKHGMNIEPWTYYPPVSMEACKMLCTTDGLDESTVEMLVGEWRDMLLDERAEIISRDQEKGGLFGEDEEEVEEEAEEDEDDYIDEGGFDYDILGDDEFDGIARPQQSLSADDLKDW